MLMLVMPIYLLQIYDRVLTSSRYETLFYISVIAVVSMACMGLFETVRSAYAARVANRLDIHNAKSAFAASIAGLTAANGDIQPLRDLSALRRFMASKAAFIFFDTPFAPLFIGVMYLIHPVLFWITAGGAALMILIAVASRLAVKAGSAKAATQQIGYMANAQIITRNADSVKSLGMSSSIINRWSSSYVEYMNHDDGVNRRTAMFGGFSKTVRMTLQIAILGVGAWLVLQNQMTAGMIFAASIVSSRGLQPLDQLISSWPQILDTLATKARLDRSLASIDDSVEFDCVPDFKGAVSTENLVFRLPQAPPNSPAIIEQINVSIKPGESICILGPNGAGKSTLLRLLAGALTPNFGFVRFDGSDIRSFDPDDLGKRVGYLGQQIELLPGTLFENISRFDPEASPDEVEAAAQRANIDAAINELPNRYQTKIGPLAYMPSGGMLQRIGLARALYGSPRFVFLDEPNANLDPDGNNFLLDSLMKMRAEGTTVVMVSQRDEIIPASDRLLIMMNGRAQQPVDTLAWLKEKKPNLLGIYYRMRGQAMPQSVVQSTRAAKNPSGEQVSPFAEFGPGLKPISVAKPKSGPETGLPK